MTISLNSPYFQFNLNPEAATWSLHGSQQDAPFIEDAWIQVSYRFKGKYFNALQKWFGVDIHGPLKVTSHHGGSQQITLTLGPDKNSLSYTIEFSLLEDHPLFLWRLTLQNLGEMPLEIERIQMMQAGFFPQPKRLPSLVIRSKKNQRQPGDRGTIRPHPEPGELAFFSNGWQSWSFSGVLGSKESFPDTRLGFLTESMWFNDGTPRPRRPGHFGSDMFGILGDRKHRSGILAGFLSQKMHFGSLEASTDPLYPTLAIWANGDHTHLNPGAQMTTDWAAIQFVKIDNPDPMAPYLDAVSREHNIQSSIINQQASVGWCSWYQFYQDISEDKLHANLQFATEAKSALPFDLFQIDDGFQSQVGDWFDFSPGFPNGVAPLARIIRETGFKPGLWLAPFIVHSRSQLKRQHPEWLLRNHRGWPVNAGFVWNNINTAIDLTHPEGLEYVKKVVQTAAHDWGFQFLKLDFLYAGAIKGRYHDRSKTPAQVLRMGLEALREAAGSEVHLLGCGVPIGPSVGIFDSMRVGADVDPNWWPSFRNIQFPFRKEYPMPSTRNAIKNTLTRASFHKRWWINDPDCLLVRPNSKLTLTEVQSLATVIALTGGPLLLSDDLPKLPKERLTIAEKMVPLMGQRPHILDWFDTTTPHLVKLELENCTGKWHLLAVFNWEEDNRDINITLKDFALPTGNYFSREFWGGVSHQISDGMLSLKQIPAHGVKLLSLRPTRSGQPCYLGSDIHISQGLEVVHWKETPSNINLHLERPDNAEGIIELYSPWPPSNILVNQNNADFQVLNKDIYRVHVQFEQFAEIEIF